MPLIITIILAVVGLNILYFTPEEQTIVAQIPTAETLVIEPTPSPTPTSKSQVANKQPEATPKPTNKPQVESTPQPTNTSGARAGRIVKYKEYCKGGQEISVYESELITRKASDGNTYSMTKDDWDCSDKNSRAVKQPSNTQTNYPPCTVYYPSLRESKTYNYMTPKDCSYWQERAKVTTKPLITCIVNYPCTGNSYTYQVNQESCNNFQQSALKICSSSQTNNTNSYVPPVEDNNQHTQDYYDALSMEQYKDCLKLAKQKYDQIMIPLIANNTSDSSMGERTIQEYESNKQQCALLVK